MVIRDEKIEAERALVKFLACKQQRIQNLSGLGLGPGFLSIVVNSHSLQTLGPRVHPVLHGASEAQLLEGQLFVDMAEQRILGCELSF